MRAVVGAVLLSLVSALSWAQTGPPSATGTREPRSLDAAVVHSGHSLTDPVVWVIGSMALASGGRRRSNDRSTVPGSSLETRWNEDHGAPGPVNARLAIADYAVMSITQAAPIGPSEWLENLAQDLEVWYDHAVTNGDGGAGADVYLYSTWPHVHNDPEWGTAEWELPFRQRLDNENARWEYFQDYVNDRRPAGAAPIHMIPGTQMMMRIYDDLQTGSVPDATDIYDFIEEYQRMNPSERDGIHLDRYGVYGIASLHYAVIYRRSPIGLPNVLQFEEYGAKVTVPPALARYLQEIAWEIATTYPRAGLAP